jgi:hypothetical protein
LTDDRAARAVTYRSEKNKESGWQQDTEIALDQFVAHVMGLT